MNPSQQKADSPSGTAKILVREVLAKMTGKTRAAYEMLDSPPRAEELHFASLRAGSAPGTHSLIFDSPADTVEITHTVRNRDGLAAGAYISFFCIFFKKRLPGTISCGIIKNPAGIIRYKR
jgi:4-hydroxy-tetrahydrodipicolinate reductase